MRCGPFGRLRSLHLLRRLHKSWLLLYLRNGPFRWLRSLHLLWGRLDRSWLSLGCRSCLGLRHRSWLWFGGSYLRLRLRGRSDLGLALHGMGLLLRSGIYRSGYRLGGAHGRLRWANRLYLCLFRTCRLDLRLMCRLGLLGRTICLELRSVGLVRVRRVGRHGACYRVNVVVGG